MQKNCIPLISFYLLPTDDYLATNQQYLSEVIFTSSSPLCPPAAIISLFLFLFLSVTSPSPPLLLHLRFLFSLSHFPLLFLTPPPLPPSLTIQFPLSYTCPWLSWGVVDFGRHLSVCEYQCPQASNLRIRNKIVEKGKIFLESYNLSFPLPLTSMTKCVCVCVCVCVYVNIQCHH